MTSTDYSKFDYLFKLALIGPAYVGKTSLMIRFADEAFTESYQSTIGIDFKVKTIKVQDKIVKIQIWDTAGQERYQPLVASQFRGAHGCICIYDITSRESFDKSKIFLNKAMGLMDSESTKYIIIGNKTDFEHKREVPETDGMELAKQYNALFLETSAKTGSKVHEAFQNLCEELVKKIGNKVGDNNESSIQKENVSLTNAKVVEEKKKSKCC